MIDKYALTAHMANILSIMDHHEGIGTTKNAFLVKEFQSCEKTLFGTLEKEQKDEARTSDQRPSGVNQDRTGQSRG